MPHKKKKNRTRCADLISYFGSPSVSACSDGQCTMPAPSSIPSMATSELSYAGQKSAPRHVNASLDEHIISSEASPDYCDITLKSAGYGFLLTFPEEAVRQLLEGKEFKGHHFSSQEIYCINQAVRTFALFGLANTMPQQTLAAPLATYLLSTLVGTRVNKETAGYIATGIVLGGMAVYLGPAAMVVGMGASLVGKTFAKASLFAAKKAVEFVAETSVKTMINYFR